MFTLSSAAIAPSLGLRGLGLSCSRCVDVELSNPRDHAGERLIALKFRLHLVGDFSSRFTRPTLAALVAIGNASLRIDSDPASLPHFWGTERVAQLGVPLEAVDERR
jgi:hypothetical protein